MSMRKDKMLTISRCACISAFSLKIYCSGTFGQ